MASQFRILRVTPEGACGCDKCRTSAPAVAATNRNEPPAPLSFEDQMPPNPQPVQNPRIDPDYDEAARVQHLPDVRYPVSIDDVKGIGATVMPLPSPLSPADFPKSK